jgi:hypothetical protein
MVCSEDSTPHLLNQRHARTTHFAKTSEPKRGHLMFKWLNRLLGNTSIPVPELSEQNDPLIGVKIGAKQVAVSVRSAMANEAGVHVESFLCALAACAGYSCQASVRRQAIAMGIDETAHFVRVECNDGKTYFFGDALNKPLAESQYSVWNLAASAAQAAGCTDILDLEDIFRHVSETVGTADFGNPRLPSEHPVHRRPVEYLVDIWPQLLPIILKYCPDPEHWPIVMSFAIHDMIIETSQILDPCVSLKVVMESAIPMSKLDLRSG